MMGVVNHVYTEIIRSMEHPWNKWIVSYEEWPRDQVTTMPECQYSRYFLENSTYSITFR